MRFKIPMRIVFRLEYENIIGGNKEHFFEIDNLR